MKNDDNRKRFIITKEELEEESKILYKELREVEKAMKGLSDPDSYRAFTRPQRKQKKWFFF